MSQTSVQEKKTIRYGSAKVLIGDRFDKLINIGAARSVAVKETITTSDIESDNAGTIATLVTEHKMELTLDSLEINFKNYAEARGGIDNIDSYDGKTEVTKQYIVESDTYKRGEEIKVPFRNADGSEVTITKVEKKNSMGNIRIEESSYEKIGTNGIKITDTKISPSTDTLIITYTRTMPKMVRMATGGKSSTIKPKCIMIVNTNAESKELRIYLPQASIAGGLEFSFPSDKAQDVLVGKLSFSATLAGSQQSGEQLAWYEDEQSVGKDEEEIKDTEEETSDTESEPNVPLTLESDKPNVDIRADGNDTVALTSNADEITHTVEPPDQQFFDVSYEAETKTFTITGKAEGTATLKITAKKAGSEDITKDISINIQAVPEALTLESDKPNVDIRADENDTVVLTSNADEITHTVEPPDQQFFDVSYEAETKTFTITGKAEGTATLKITAKKTGSEDIVKDIEVNINANI
ncbi:hypothetical protein [Brachyspira murdochii]|uniref:Uncharacterized protein n=1 Tax=Brachyspira murdochii (strain ATCC 51284 / DSM 12563 / 56-150) TaxID=526224 RepID=D5U4T5_BRAM5|nr:hypothetical protein [Brachyspira murdochii]ADG72339.1 hypothetical protein Bmur_2266 [Brachyspira murdochii DSM 12563]